jgi:hypothetical protein
VYYDVVYSTTHFGPRAEKLLDNYR